MRNARLFLVGDPPRSSDVGKFCLRLRDSGYTPKPVYIDSSLASTAISKLNQERLSSTSIVACNVVNNVNLFANILSARLLGEKLSAPVTYIVHDGKIEYPTHIAAMISIGDNTYTKKYQRISRSVENFVNQCIPKHLIGRFVHGYDYEERGKWLLGLVLGNSDTVFCHSDFCKEIIEESLEIFRVSSKGIVRVLPLAYGDHQHSEHLSANYKPTERKMGAQVVIGVYGMFFNSAKNIELLVSTLKHVEGMGHSCRVWLSGRADTNLACALEKQLSFLSGGFRFHGFVDEENLNSLIRESSFIWAYRNPTHGETSGTVLRAFAHGTCPIICNIGSYREFPGSLALGVSPSASSEEIAQAILAGLERANEERRARIEYIQRVHAPSLYLSTIMSTCALDPRQALSEIKHECAIYTHEGLLAEGYLFSSMVSFSSLTAARFNCHETALSHEQKVLHARIGPLHIGFNEELSKLYSAACSPVAKIVPDHKNEHQFGTRFDYIYFALKQMLQEKSGSPLVASNLIITPVPGTLNAPTIDIEAHISAVARAIRDYSKWHRESDLHYQLLDSCINLGGLELLAPVLMLRNPNISLPWTIDDCWTALCIYDAYISDTLKEELGQSHDRWVRVLARSKDIMTSVISSTIA